MDLELHCTRGLPTAILILGGRVPVHTSIFEFHSWLPLMMQLTTTHHQLKVPSPPRRVVTDDLPGVFLRYALGPKNLTTPAVNSFSDKPVTALTETLKTFHRKCAKFKIRWWMLHFPRTTTVYGLARFGSPGCRVVENDTSIVEVDRSLRMDQGPIDD